MRISEHVHQIKIDFNVTPTIKRFVYIYVILGRNCYLIDSGVSGSEKIISEYLNSINRDIKDIKTIFLTHSHPDHLGGAKKIKDITGCKISANSKELSWIENIDQEFNDRPIPNFYKLLNSSVKVDLCFTNTSIFNLEPGLTLKAIPSYGHSHGSTSFLLEEEGILFTGDAIPDIHDIPIYVDYEDCLNTLFMLKTLKGLKYICPAWDHVYNEEEIEECLDNSIDFINGIDSFILEKKKFYEELDSDNIIDAIVDSFDNPFYQANKLFRATVAAHINKKHLNDIL